MEWITGLITNVQELPGVTQKAHNAPFLAWPAKARLAGQTAGQWNATGAADLLQQMLVRTIINSLFVDFWADWQN